jgi:hypothetical protein
MGQLSKLDEALLAAQADAPVLPGDSRNNHAGYQYTSAKQIIAIGSALLRRHGLLLIPMTSELLEDGRLSCEYALRHAASGQAQAYSRIVGVHAHRGKEVDKAACAADTSAFAYMYRRILSLPDVECEINDTPPAPDPIGERVAPVPVKAPAKAPVRPPAPPAKLRVPAVVEVGRGPVMTSEGARMAKEIAEQTVERTAVEEPAHREATAHAGNNSLLRERLRDLSMEFRRLGDEDGYTQEDRARLIEGWAGVTLIGPHPNDPKARTLRPDRVTEAILVKIEGCYESWKASRGEMRKVEAAEAAALAASA